MNDSMIFLSPDGNALAVANPDGELALFECSAENGWHGTGMVDAVPDDWTRLDPSAELAQLRAAASVFDQRLRDIQLETQKILAGHERSYLLMKRERNSYATQLAEALEQRHGLWELLKKSTRLSAFASRTLLKHHENCDPQSGERWRDRISGVVEVVRQEAWSMMDGSPAYQVRRADGTKAWRSREDLTERELQPFTKESE